MRFLRAMVFFIVLALVAAMVARLWDQPRSTGLILLAAAGCLCVVLLIRTLSGQRRLHEEFQEALSAVTSLSLDEAEAQTMELASAGSVKLVPAAGSAPALVDQAGPTLSRFLRHFQLIESEEMRMGWPFLRLNGDRIVLGEDGLTYVFESGVGQDEIRILSRSGDLLFTLPSVFHLLPWKWGP
jgi:hypothetical protein